MITKDPDDLRYVSESELASVREQLQEDIRTCMEGMWNMDEKHLIEDMLCQILLIRNYHHRIFQYTLF